MGGEVEFVKRGRGQPDRGLRDGRARAAELHLARLRARYDQIKAETVSPHYPPSDPESYPDTRGLDAWYPWL